MRSPQVVRRKFLAGLFVLLAAGQLPAQTTRPASEYIQTIEFAIPGSHEGTTSKAIVAVPKTYAGTDTRYPVAYVLHGYSGNQEDWFKHTQGTNRALNQLADRFGMIIVLPDGKYNSWYMDSVADSPDAADYQWETMITKYLVPEIDKRYRTWADPAGRGITGLSMGGHGAMYLCARHPELFSVGCTMSGVMDLRPCEGKYQLDQRLGDYGNHPERWLEHSVIGLAEKFAGRKVGILIDCGLQDSAFIGGNQALHRKLIELNVPHDYLERPGAHTWDYWLNALPYHLQFMADRLKPAGPR